MLEVMDLCCNVERPNGGYHGSYWRQRTSSACGSQASKACTRTNEYSGSVLCAARSPCSLGVVVYLAMQVHYQSIVEVQIPEHDALAHQSGACSLRL